MIYLYMRVSTGLQTTDTQEHDLGKRFPQGLVYKETASGIKDRPKLQQLLETVKPGDTIAVAALDRLGRRLSDILTMIEGLHKRGVNVVSLREGMDYSTASGRAFTHIMLVIAELERDLIGQRTSAAMQAMKARGEQIGRAPTHSPENLDLARRMRSEGESYRAISKVTRISVGRLSQIFGTRLKKKAA